MARPKLAAVLILLLVPALGSWVLPSYAAEPAKLTSDERVRLDRGEIVSRSLVLARSPRPRAAISYAVVNAPPEQLGARLSDGRRFVRMLPYLLEARTLSDEPESSRYFIRQGLPAVSGKYHLLVEWGAGRRSGRFRLDPKAPHDLPELWGYFRFEPFGEGRSLVTFAIAFRLPLALRSFENVVLEAALTTPARLRMLVP